MKRRNFLRMGLAGSSLPFFMGPNISRSFASPQENAWLQAEGGEDRCLVVFRMGGGNDGLNTLFPLDYYDELKAGRGDLLIDKEKLLQIEKNAAFHPSMSGMAELYKNGRLGIVQGAGYPNSNGSHFRSTNIWLSAVDFDQEVITSGWLGRYLESQYPDFPNDYPNAQFPDPPSVHTTGVVPLMLQADPGSMAVTVVDPQDLAFDGIAHPNEHLMNTPAGHELAFIRTIAQQTKEYSIQLIEAYERGKNLSTLWDTSDPVHRQFMLIARLISGGLKTRIYSATKGQFDTHNNQFFGKDPSKGTHADLLHSVSSGIHAFMDDLEKLGLDDRVMGVTISEFGRRILANGNYGTDHGKAAPMFLFGKHVQGGIFGKSPELPKNPTKEDDVNMQVDFRSIYYSLLKDWMQASETVCKKSLLKEFPTVPVIKSASGLRSTSKSTAFTLSKNFPNPAKISTNVKIFLKHNEQVELSIFNLQGKKIKQVTQGMFSSGEHDVTIDVTDMKAGKYFYRLTTQSEVKENIMDVF